MWVQQLHKTAGFTPPATQEPEASWSLCKATRTHRQSCVPTEETQPSCGKSADEKNPQGAGLFFPIGHHKCQALTRESVSWSSAHMVHPTATKQREPRMPACTPHHLIWQGRLSSGQSRPMKSLTLPSHPSFRFFAFPPQGV